MHRRESASSPWQTIHLCFYIYHQTKEARHYDKFLSFFHICSVFLIFVSLLTFPDVYSTLKQGLFIIELYLTKQPEAI